MMAMMPKLISTDNDNHDDVHDDDHDDVHGDDHDDNHDLYIMVKCVCVCHEKVTKFFFSLPNYF